MASICASVCECSSHCTKSSVLTLFSSLDCNVYQYLIKNTNIWCYINYNIKIIILVWRFLTRDFLLTLTLYDLLKLLGSVLNKESKLPSRESLLVRWSKTRACTRTRACMHWRVIFARFLTLWPLTKACSFTSPFSARRALLACSKWKTSHFVLFFWD